MFSGAICPYAMSVPPGESSESNSKPAAPPIGFRRTGMGLLSAKDRTCPVRSGHSTWG
jgi:hypothetical protein